MSQVSGVTGDSAASQTAKTPAGRAIILLAVAVLVGVAILSELDKSPTATTETKGQTATQTPPTKSETQTQTSSSVTTPVTAAARTPAEVRVLVANGVGITGAASKITGRLQPVGYVMLKPGDTLQRQTSSGVLYSAGYQAEAQAVASGLGLTAGAVQQITANPVADMQNANIVVIVGTDLANSTSAAQSGTTQNSTATSTTVTNSALNGPLTQNNSGSSGSGTQSSVTTTPRT